MREGRFELSGFALRMIAMLCMLVDHVGVSFFPGVLWLRCVGRLAFPIFAFLVAEGSVYTHDKKKYLLRLFALAVVSEIPFDLMSSAAAFSFGRQNVVWTLLISLAGIFLSERLLSEKKELAGGLVLAAAVLLCELCRTDYGAIGALTVLMFRYFRGEKLPLAAGITAANGLLAFGADYPAQLCAAAALLPIFAYRGRQGPHSRVLRLVFYGFYPVHMIVLAVLSIELWA